MSRDREETDRLAQSDLHNQRGIELADRGWLDESVKEFRKAIELDPESAHAHDNLATVYAEKGELFEALRAYLIAIELEPASPTAHHNLACFLATHGYELSIREYKKVTEIEFDYPDVHLNLGLTLAERGQFVEALKEYEIALDLRPEDTVARHEMATVLMDMGRYADAIPQLRDVTRQAPDSLDAHIDLGIAYTIKGFYNEAEKALTRALGLDGGDIMANYHMAALRAAQGRDDDVPELLARACEVDKDRVRSWVEGDRFFDRLRHSERIIELLADG
jgi:Flp pilus assembly protein TadD